MPAYCRQCGTKLSPGAKFCKQCGLQVTKNSQDIKDKLSPSPETVGAGKEVHSAPRPSKSSKSGAKKSLAIAVGGISILLCVSVLAGGVIFFRQILLGRQVEPEIIAQGDTPDIILETNSEEQSTAAYTPRQVAPSETTPESASGTTSTEPTRITLSDGTQVEIPGSHAPATLTLSRESNTIQLTEKPDLQTSGSMRVLEFDLSEVGDNFIPRLTIPAAELGSLDLATTNVVRVGQYVVNGEMLPDDVAYLAVERDNAGNLVVVDGMIPTIEDATAMLKGGGRPHMVSLKRQSSNRSRASYVLMTFQNHLEWSYEPRLIRMIPDNSVAEFRRPADLERDKELLQKPVINVIVLVHGHNEEEKDGSRLAESEIQPWGVSYKREVWTELYRTYLERKEDQLDCTAFYEYIYPTYRSAYSPLAEGSAEPLGISFAKIMAEGASNDDKQLGKIMQANMPVNLYIVAHSMGGLVARAGIREFNEPLKKNFQQLVTWGTPHHGGALVSMGYLFRGAYKVNYGKLREANWFPWYIQEGTVDLLLGSELMEYIQDWKIQLDTPGTRDLRWDNFSPLRLDEIFSADTLTLMIDDLDGIKYNLVNGTWLYNDNLRRFNESDPYRFSEKYTFLYGVTTKRMPFKAETAMGATLTSFMMKNGNQPVTAVSSGHTAGDSDGAVPLASMAGVGIVNYRSIYLGDVDHEEYYDKRSDVLYGGMVARQTFERLGLSTPRCDCATLEMESAGDLKAIAIDAPLDVQAQFRVNPALEPKPGKRMQSAEALFYIAGTKDEFTLGEMDIDDDGKLSGSFSMPDLGEGEHQLVVRAYFADKTQLDSTPKAKAIYTGIRVVASSHTNGYCFKSDGDYTSFAYHEEGKINWIGNGSFSTSLINNNFIPILLEKLTGTLSPDGRSLTLQFEYAYTDEYEGVTQEITGNGSFINIPLTEHVLRDGLEYDRFIFTGNLAVLRPHMQFWHQELITSAEETKIKESTFDSLASCDGPGFVEVWMFIAGRTYEP